MATKHVFFETAFGSVVGRTHSLIGQPNQDAVIVRETETHVVLVVADGCGSAAKSEVGAWFGASVLASELGVASEADLMAPTYPQHLWERVLSAIKKAALLMGGNLEEVVHEFFLFTLIGAVIVGERAMVLSLGDGLVSINGKVAHLGPFANNAPPYIAHLLLGQAEDLAVIRRMPSRDIESVVIATDGASEWEGLCNQTIPGEKERVGPISQFIACDAFFRNPDGLRRKLARMNRTVSRPNWGAQRLEKEAALLLDDTTIAAARRRRNVGHEERAART